MRATDTLFSTTAQFQILRVPTSSNGTTFGPGSANNLLKSNGTSVYWTTLVASDIPTISITDKTSGTLPVTRGGTGVTAIANIQAGKDGDGNTISSTYLKLSGGTLTGDLGIIIGDTDKFLNFWYNTNKTAGASWRLGALGSGSDDTNYFIIQSGTSTSTATTWNNVIRIGQNTYDAAFGGNIYPLTNNTKTLGTSSNKWSNVYSTTFTGDLTGNAATATTLSANATDTTKVFFRGDRTWSNVIKQTSNAALGIDTNLKIGTAKKDLNFAITNGSGTGINDGYAGGITWGDDGSAYAGIYYQTSGSYGSRLIFGTTNSYANGVYARMIITSEGKVGIGRLIPSSLLGVDGTITLTGDLDITNYLFTLSLVNDKYSGRQGLKSSGYGQYYDGTGISAMESEAWLVYRDASGNVFLDGNAYSATRDGSGNTITSTYLKLSGGTMTGNLVAKKITIEHTSGEGQEYRVTYGSTVDMSLMIGTGNENHGIYDSKASKWMIYADVNGNVTVNGNAATATKATQDGSGNTITSTYLKLSGGSMTGRLTFNKVQNAIAYQGTKAWYDMIKFIDNTGDGNGNGIYIGGGGATIIGGGESADTAAGQVSGGSEILYLCNDGDVNVFTNMQNGWNSRKTFTFGSNGNIVLPAGCRIGESGEALYLGNSNNSNWIYTQDICSQDSRKWRLHADGRAEFEGTVTATGKILAKEIWGNQGSNGERQVGVDSATTGNLYMWANTTDKGIYSGSGWMTGHVIRITSDTRYFFGTVISGSSKEIKTNIHYLNNTDYIDKLEPVSFNYIKDEKKKTHFGLIYEDTLNILPNICTDPDGDEQKGINYLELVPILLKEIQNLRKRIKLLENNK